MNLIKSYSDKISELPVSCCCCGERCYRTKNIKASKLKEYGVINDYTEKELDNALYLFDPVIVNEETTLRICKKCNTEAKRLSKRRLRNLHVTPQYSHMNTGIPKWRDREWQALKGLSLVEQSMIAIVAPLVAIQNMLGMFLNHLIIIILYGYKTHYHC